jgi:hypothetical protein
MSGLPDLEKTISRLEAATEAAVAATREAHSTLKALRQADRDARQTYMDMVDDTRSQVRQIVSATLEASSLSLSSQLEERLELALKRTEAIVQQRADNLTQHWGFTTHSRST